MRLEGLVSEASLQELGLLDELVGERVTDVTGITMDSRAAGPGTLFACVPGAHNDGHDFAAEAVGSGAVALLCERTMAVPVPQIVVRSVRRALGPVADAFFGHPSEALTVIGVTGTNGKTTTCALVESVFQAAGRPATTIGTLTQPRTTPEAPDLQSLLAEWRDSGGQVLAMEVSSHALDQHRVDGTRFAAAVFTNLSPEHLDYHGTMDAYFDAKARLFDPAHTEVAVVNRGDPWGVRLADRLLTRQMRVETYSIDDVGAVEAGPSGTTFEWDGQRMSIRLVGRFNVVNAIAAATCGRALGLDSDQIRQGLESLAGVAGRLQPVEAGQPFTVLVDYAHTPDGLAQALRAARELATGRVVVVFGAGGDRDRDKRPLMGAAAAEHSDLAVLTSDNPRSEDPGRIIDEVLSGVGDQANVVVEPDRAAAIATALATAETGDVVLIAGKGHETAQEIGGRTVPFVDAQVARDAIQRILGSRRDAG